MHTHYLFMTDAISGHYWLGLASTPFQCFDGDCIGRNKWSDGSFIYNFGGFMDINIFENRNCLNMKPMKDIQSPISCDYNRPAVCMSKCTKRTPCQSLPLISEANVLYNAQHALTAGAIVR